MRVYGVTGRKDQGKTTLVERLVAEFVRRGLTVSTIKHTHHGVDLDVPGTDSFRHREAGAGEVILASDARFALMHESRDGETWPLEALISRLAPVDLVLIEGYKSEPHRKIEVCRVPRDGGPLAETVPGIRAFAGEPGAAWLPDLPRFDPDDVGGIAAFVLDDAEVIG